MNYSAIGIKLVFVASVCVLLLLSACECDQCEEETFEIINETDHYIELITYYNPERIRETYILEKGGESIVFECESDRSCSPSKVLLTDSVTVIFDNKRYWPHEKHPTLNPANNNILREAHYENPREGYYVFRINEQDYEQSIPLPE
jgi:5-deoxy-D-glucuronate isomerase